MTLKVVPQRNDGKGWRLTFPHRAQRWALVATSRGEHMRVLATRKSKQECESLLVATQRATEKVFGYQLGKRMPKKELQS